MENGLNPRRTRNGDLKVSSKQSVAVVDWEQDGVRRGFFFFTSSFLLVERSWAAAPRAFPWRCYYFLFLFFLLLRWSWWFYSCFVVLFDKTTIYSGNQWRRIKRKLIINCCSLIFDNVGYSSCISTSFPFCHTDIKQLEGDELSCPTQKQKLSSGQ